MMTGHGTDITGYVIKYRSRSRLSHSDDYDFDDDDDEEEEDNGGDSDSEDDDEWIDDDSYSAVNVAGNKTQFQFTDELE